MEPAHCFLISLYAAYGIDKLHLYFIEFLFCLRIQQETTQ